MKLIKVGEICESISNTYCRMADKVVLVNTSDVFDGKILNHSYVKNEKLKGQFKKTFKENDILYSEIRPANRRFAFVDFENTDDYIASTKLMVIRADENEVNPRFLFAYLTSKTIISELQSLAETRSGTFPQITFSGEVANLIINLPDRKSQDAIVKVLSCIDRKIDTNNAINHNLAA